MVEGEEVEAVAVIRMKRGRLCGGRSGDGYQLAERGMAGRPVVMQKKQAEGQGLGDNAAVVAAQSGRVRAKRIRMFSPDASLQMPGTALQSLAASTRNPALRCRHGGEAHVVPG